MRLKADNHNTMLCYAYLSSARLGDDVEVDNVQPCRAWNVASVTGARALWRGDWLEGAGPAEGRAANRLGNGLPYLLARAKRADLKLLSVVDVSVRLLSVVLFAFFVSCLYSYMVVCG
jgi:hypothetical protein